MRALLLTLVLLLVAGCSSSGGTPSHVAPSTNGIPAHATAGPSADADFMRSVNLNMPTVQASTAIHAAHLLCADFDRGVPWLKELRLMLDLGFPASTSGGFIAAAVLVYCPQHADILP